MRYLLLALLLVGCTPRLTDTYEAIYPEPRTPTEQAVVDVCGRHGAVCVPDPEVPNGRINHGTWDFGVVQTKQGYIRYNPEFCAKSQDLCVFVLLHEVGHREEGSDQTAADCWAARWATDAEVQAGIDQLKKWGEYPRAERLVECSK